MAGLNTRKELKTGKNQKCLGCLKKIPHGLNAIKNSEGFEVEFYSYYLHLECDSFLEKHSDYLCKGVWEGCVSEIKAKEKCEMHIETYELSDELIKREGVSSFIVNPHEECVITTGTESVKITGPAVIIINQD